MIEVADRSTAWRAAARCASCGSGRRPPAAGGHADRPERSRDGAALRCRAERRRRPAAALCEADGASCRSIAAGRSSPRDFRRSSQRSQRRRRRRTFAPGRRHRRPAARSRCGSSEFNQELHHACIRLQTFRRRSRRRAVALALGPRPRCRTAAGRTSDPMRTSMIAKADEGADALRRYAFITRAIHQLDATEVANSLDAWRAEAGCVKKTASRLAGSAGRDRAPAAPVRAETQPAGVAGHLEVAAADAAAGAVAQARQAFPVDRAGAGAAVELLVVLQGLDREARRPASSPSTRPDSAPSTPGWSSAGRRRTRPRRREVAHRAAGGPMAAARPERLPSRRRRRNAVSAPPSSRFMPIQSQPTASASSSASLHSWSSQARPATATGSPPPSASRPRHRSCGWL